MDISKKVNEHARLTKIAKSKISPYFRGVKLKFAKALSSLTAVTSVDSGIYSIVVASLGALVSAVFSKACKKMILTFALVCTFGSAFLIYKSLFKTKEEE